VIAIMFESVGGRNGLRFDVRKPRLRSVITVREGEGWVGPTGFPKGATCPQEELQAWPYSHKTAIICSRGFLCKAVRTEPWSQQLGPASG